MKLFAALLLFALFTLSGCVTATKAAEPALTSSDEPGDVASIQAWDALSKDARQQIIEGDYHRYKNLTMTPRQRSGEVPAGELRAFADKMAAYMRANGDMAGVDTSHARVGGVETYVQILQLAGKPILGGQVTFQQQGCDMPDESAHDFRSGTEAEGAGCELGVGFWAAYGAFDHGGRPLEYGDFLEWEPTGSK